MSVRSFLPPIRSFLLAAIITLGVAPTAIAMDKASLSTSHPGEVLRICEAEYPAAERAINYWNYLADETLLVAANSDCHATIFIEDPPDSVMGYYLKGRVSIRPDVQVFWGIHAHEFGHALGFGHHGSPHDGTDYEGIMSYDYMMTPDPRDDAKLLASAGFSEVLIPLPVKHGPMLSEIRHRLSYGRAV